VLCVEFILVRATVDIVNGTVLCLEFLVVTATLDIVQCYCVVFGSLLWLLQQ